MQFQTHPKETVQTMINKILLSTLVLLSLPLLAFKQQQVNGLKIVNFHYANSKVYLSIMNNSKDSIAFPNIYLRMSKHNKRYELRTEFYKVSNDTLYISLSSKPTLSSVKTSHRIEGMYIEGVYNDYKIEAEGLRDIRFNIDLKYKKIKIKNLVFQYDSTIVR